LATCVAAKAKNRKRKVPTNSPVHAMNRWRTLLGSHPKPGRRRSPTRFGSSVYLVFMPGKTMRFSEGWFKGCVALTTAAVEVLELGCETNARER